jgi:hypothetical protein
LITVCFVASSAEAMSPRQKESWKACQRAFPALAATVVLDAIVE